jgi:hypothetical protein
MGKPSVPAAPDYTPFIQASQQTAAADSHAADLQFSSVRKPWPSRMCMLRIG